MQKERNVYKLVVIDDKHFLSGMHISAIIYTVIEESYVTVDVISDQPLNSV